MHNVTTFYYKYLLPKCHKNPCKNFHENRDMYLSRRVLEVGPRIDPDYMYAS